MLSSASRRSRNELHPKAGGHPSRSRSAFARPLELRKKSRHYRPAKVGTERRRRVNSWIGRAGLVSAAKGFVRPHPCAGIERDVGWQ